MKRFLLEVRCKGQTISIAIRRNGWPIMQRNERGLSDASGRVKLAGLTRLAEIYDIAVECGSVESSEEALGCFSVSQVSAQRDLMGNGEGCIPTTRRQN